MRRARAVPTLVVLALVAAAIYALAAAPAGPRSIRRFEPDRLANLELRMWQAYYARQNVRLFALLLATLREQYHYSWAVAAREGFHLARAAATFAKARDHYEVVLPDLEAAYTTAARWLRAGFDPAAVARAELAWWVARRIPGQKEPAQVGGLIADEYALLYEAPRSAVLRAALLRAQAAAIRDEQAQQPDWEAIGSLLQRSYRDLAENLSRPSPE
jgi:hypothetical protein